MIKVSTPYTSTSYAYDKLNRIIRVVDHNGKATLYEYDENGNVRTLTDVEGAVTDTYDYDSYGIVTASTGLTVNPYRYCGEYQDETTGLYYLRAGYYDNATGIFISAGSYSGSVADFVSSQQ